MADQYPVIHPVVIKWVDSSTTSGWHHEYIKSNLYCISVGHLVSKDKDSVVICLNLSADGALCSYMEIPMVAVKSIRKLKV